MQPRRAVGGATQLRLFSEGTNIDTTPAFNRAQQARSLGEKRVKSAQDNSMVRENPNSNVYVATNSITSKSTILHYNTAHHLQHERDDEKKFARGCPWPATIDLFPERVLIKHALVSTNSAFCLMKHQKRDLQSGAEAAHSTITACKHAEKPKKPPRLANRTHHAMQYARRRPSIFLEW